MTLKTKYPVRILQCNRAGCGTELSGEAGVGAIRLRQQARDQGWQCNNPGGPVPVLDLCPRHRVEQLEEPDELADPAIGAGRGHGGTEGGAMRQVELSDAQKNAIWDTLVEWCDASEAWRANFLHHFPQCVEFRFQGDLGYGGKVWADRGKVYVNCYREDETPEALAEIKRANAALATIVAGGDHP